MNVYQPDLWVVLKIGDMYKVFGSWYGGYLHGDSWRLNSGIREVKIIENKIEFHGYSGSVYECLLNKQSYGTSGYSGGILANLLEDHGNISVMPFDTNWSELVNETV
jgi:hypothetical protein